MRGIIFPLAMILIALKWIMISSNAIGLIILYLSLIYTTIIIHISTFPMCGTLFKSAKEMRAVFEKKLSLSMETISIPFSMIKTLRRIDLLESITENTLQLGLVFEFICWQLVNIFANNRSESSVGLFLRDKFILALLSDGGIEFSVIAIVFVRTAVILPHYSILIIKNNKHKSFIIIYIIVKII